MKQVYQFIILIFLPFIAEAQAPSIQWQKSYGGTGDEVAWSVRQTSDGGYVYAGTSNSANGDLTGNHGDDDVWVVKLNSSGTLQWQKNFGGTDIDEAYSIEQTTDGGYIVAGSTFSNDGDVTLNHGNYDFWVLKLTSTGSLQWQKSLGGTNNDQANAVQQTSDGGYIVVGSSFSNNGDATGNHGGADYWVVKLNSLGVLQWQKSLGGSDDDAGFSIQQTADGGFVLNGYSSSIDGQVTGNHGDYDFWIVKLNSSGTLQWQKSLGGTAYDAGHSVIQTADGGYIATGSGDSNDGDLTFNNGDDDYWIVKMDTSGTIQWQKSYGGSDADQGSAIIQTADGGYAVAGLSPSLDFDVTGNHGMDDVWILKLNSTGILQWQKSIGGTGEDGGVFIQQTADNGYVVCGLSETANGDITFNHGNDDAWIIKLNAVTGIDESASNPVSVYPNPSSGQFYFSGLKKGNTIEITDLLGRKIIEQEATDEKQQIELYQAKGVYFYKITDKNKLIQCGKICVE